MYVDMTNPGNNCAVESGWEIVDTEKAISNADKEEPSVSSARSSSTAGALSSPTNNAGGRDVDIQFLELLTERFSRDKTGRIAQNAATANSIRSLTMR